MQTIYVQCTQFVCSNQLSNQVFLPIYVISLRWRSSLYVLPGQLFWVVLFQFCSVLSSQVITGQKYHWQILSSFYGLQLLQPTVNADMLRPIIQFILRSTTGRLSPASTVYSQRRYVEAYNTIHTPSAWITFMIAVMCF